MSDKSDRRDFLGVDPISPLPISNRVREQRVLSLEVVISVERAILWPDSDGEQAAENHDDEAARAQEEKA